MGLAGADPERRLVYLRQTPTGYLAELAPRYDYTTFLSRQFRVEGVDKSVLAAVSNAQGLPVRLYGNYSGDRVQVPRALGQAPAVLPVTGARTLWRGRMHAVPVGPERVRLDVGPGETVEATLRFDNPGEREAWARWSQQPECSLGGTFLDGTLVDLTFGPWNPPRESGSYRVLLQLSETFLTRVATAWLQEHPLAFTDKQGLTGFAVREMGLTLLDCQPGEARLYGRLDGRVMGMPVVEGEWEGRVVPTFREGRLTVPLVPNSLVLRLTRPFFMAVPPAWVDGLRTLLGSGPALPDLYRADLVASGLLDDAQVNAFTARTAPTGDRRTGMLVALAPQGPGTSELLRSRLARGAEFAVALSPEAVNTALARTIPKMLPLRRPIPPELQGNTQVFLFKLKLREAEVSQLDLGYAGGRFLVRDALINIHWTLGPASGVEPGARVAGSAAVTGEGSPLKLRLDPDVTKLEFLSKHVTDQSPQEQAALREQLIRSLKGTPLDLPLPVTAGLLELVGVGTDGPDLILQGRCATPPARP